MENGFMKMTKNKNSNPPPRKSVKIAPDHLKVVRQGLFCCVLFSLLIFSCPNTYIFLNNTADLPPGYGSVTLSLSNNVSRTIFPNDTPGLGYFDSFTFTFEQLSSGGPIGPILGITDSQLTGNKYSPIVMAVGTYRIVVFAYRDGVIAAQGEKIFDVRDGFNEDVLVTLRMSLEHGTGTFILNVTINAADVETATMTVRDSAGAIVSSLNQINLLTQNAGFKDDLASGVYTIVFNLVKEDGNNVTWYEILHIYSTLASTCTITFEDWHFSQSAFFNVTFYYFDDPVGTTTQSYMSGTTIASGGLPSIYKRGHVITGWFTTQNFIPGTEWNIDTAPITEDINLYAMWVDNTFIIEINFEDLEAAPDLGGPVTIYRQGHGEPTYKIFTITGQFDSYTWYLNNAPITLSFTITGDTRNFTLNETAIPQTVIPQSVTYLLTLEVVKDGKPYSRTITLNVLITETFPSPKSKIAAGWAHSLLIKDDGTLWAWGSNEYGQLGISNTENKIVPVQVGNENNWIFVTAGGNSTFAIKEGGSLWAWGQNEYSRLGINNDSIPFESEPVRIGTDNDWVMVSAGGQHALAIKTDGSLWTWGNNNYGQLGDGGTADRTSPIQIGSDKDWAFVSAGSNHTLALKTDSSLWVWGSNEYGLLGLGDDPTIKREPVRLGTANDWSYISAGYMCSAAIKKDGSLWGWGTNGSWSSSGETINVPRRLRTNDSDWETVSAGNQIIARKTNGSIWTSNRMIGTDTDWDIFVVRSHTVALKKDGSLWTWGNNSDGQLGNGLSEMINSPVRLGTDSDWDISFTGIHHSFALKKNGSTWAWGFNYAGQLGNGTSWPEFQPSPINIQTSINWSDISVMQLQNFGVDKDGVLWNWGSGGTGFSNSSVPIRTFEYTTFPDAVWLSVSGYNEWPTERYTAIMQDGTLWVWGGGDSQNILGDAQFNSNYRGLPVQVGSATDWKTVSVGQNHTLAIKADGELWAWGNNNAGQVGDETNTNRFQPVRIGSDKNWVSISAYAYHSMAIDTEGGLWAWGNNQNGQLGNNTTTSQNRPVRIKEDIEWGMVSTSRWRTAAVCKNGHLWAWGNNNAGQVGDGTIENRNLPVMIGADNDWVHVSMSEGWNNLGYTIAIKEDGSMWGWGRFDMLNIDFSTPRKILP